MENKDKKQLQCPQCKGLQFTKLITDVVEVFTDGAQTWNEDVEEGYLYYRCFSCGLELGEDELVQMGAEQASSVSSSGEADIQGKKAKRTLLSCPECKYTLFYRVLTNSVEVFAEGAAYRCEVKDGGEVRFRCTSCGGEFYSGDLEQLEAEQASPSYSQAKCGSECPPDWLDSEKSARISPCGNESERRCIDNGNTNANNS